MSSAEERLLLPKETRYGTDLESQPAGSSSSRVPHLIGEAYADDEVPPRGLTNPLLSSGRKPRSSQGGFGRLGRGDPGNDDDTPLEEEEEEGDPSRDDDPGAGGSRGLTTSTPKQLRRLFLGVHESLASRDLLVASWLFLLGSLVFTGCVACELALDATSLPFWMLTLSGVLFSAGSAFFIRAFAGDKRAANVLFGTPSGLTNSPRPSTPRGDDDDDARAFGARERRRRRDYYDTEGGVLHQEDDLTRRSDSVKRASDAATRSSSTCSSTDASESAATSKPTKQPTGQSRRRRRARDPVNDDDDDDDYVEEEAAADGEDDDEEEETTTCSPWGCGAASYYRECASRHLATDLLVASWLFLLACVPVVIASVCYVIDHDDRLYFWGVLAGSLAFCIASGFFVVASYPDHLRPPTKTPLYEIVVGLGLLDPDAALKHCGSDWIVSNWCFLLLTAGWLVASLVFVVIHPHNSDYQFSAVEAVIYLLASVYFVKGSYVAQEEADELFKLRDLTARRRAHSLSSGRRRVVAEKPCASEGLSSRTAERRDDDDVAVVVSATSSTTSATGSASSPSPPTQPLGEGNLGTPAASSSSSRSLLGWSRK